MKKIKSKSDNSIYTGWLAGWLLGNHARFILTCNAHSRSRITHICLVFVVVIVGGVLYSVVWFGFMVDPLFVHTTNIMAQKRCLARSMIDEWFSRALNEILPSTHGCVRVCLC